VNTTSDVEFSLTSQKNLKHFLNTRFQRVYSLNFISLTGYSYGYPVKESESLMSAVAHKFLGFHHDKFTPWSLYDKGNSRSDLEATN
jgi:hypothetical protein